MSIRDTLLGIEHSIQLISDKQEELFSQINSLGKDITNLKERAEQVEAKTSADEIKKTKEELNDMQRYSRRENLEVHEVPFVEGENTLVRLNTINDELKLTHLDEANVEAMQRSPNTYAHQTTVGFQIPISFLRFRINSMKYKTRSTVTIFRFGFIR